MVGLTQFTLTVDQKLGLLLESRAVLSHIRKKESVIVILTLFKCLYFVNHWLFVLIFSFGTIILKYYLFVLLFVIIDFYLFIYSVFWHSLKILHLSPMPHSLDTAGNASVVGFIAPPSQKKMCPPSRPQNLCIWLYLERVLVDIIKDLELRLSGLSGWAVNPMTGVLRRGRRRDTCTREGHVKTEAEVGVILPQAKEPLERAQPCQLLDFRIRHTDYEGMPFCCGHLLLALGN